jgi:hypothetical protein
MENPESNIKRNKRLKAKRENQPQIPVTLNQENQKLNGLRW